MTKCKYLLLIVLLFSVFISPVSALCNYEEQAALNKEAANVKASYEIVTKPYADQSNCYPPEDIDDSESYQCVGQFIQINILNISENMKLEISDDYYNVRRNYFYTDTDDGKLELLLSDKNGLEVAYNENVINYTIKINASSKTGCEGSTLRTIYLTLPRYNVYSTVAPCDELTDYYLCQSYVTYDEISYDSFSQQITEELAKREETNEEELKWYQKVWEYIVKHKNAFIIGGVLVVVATGGTITYIVIRRRRDLI